MSQAEERLIMTNDAYGTVEVPAAPKKKSSLKRLVATSAAISLALGFATVTAVDHGLINLSGNNYVQIKLRGTDFCLGVLNRKEAKERSNLIIYGCDSKMIGQAFQIEEVKGKTNTYNIKYNTKNGGSKYDETLCVNYPTNGGTLQLYKCKKNDAHSEWTYQGKKLMVKAFDECMATEGSSQSSLSNSNYVEGMWCGEKFSKWDMSVPETDDDDDDNDDSPGTCNHYCKSDRDCVWLGGSNPCKTCYRNECVRRRPTPAPRPTSRPQGNLRCNGLCYGDYDCPSSCPKCLDYGDGVRKTCQKPKPQKGQCDRKCSYNYDCANNGGKWTTGQPWCGQCKGGWCTPNKRYCDKDWDCDRDVSECGPNGYCVGK